MMLLASGDTDRIWWEDAYEWLGELETMYTDALLDWARISRGAFQPTDIVETWDPGGPVTVEFTLDGVRYRLSLKSQGEMLDLDIFGPINALIAPRGLRFEDVDTGDQTTCLVAVTAEEKGALTRRGWPFLNDLHVTRPPPRAPPPGNRSPPVDAPKKKGWLSRK